MAGGNSVSSDSPIEDLIRTVEGHEPFDPMEGHHRSGVLEFLRTSACPFDAASFEPGHVVGSACIVAPETGEIVLVAHAKLGRWLQPGGHIDPDEAGPLPAAIRESREEVGIDLDRNRAVLLDLDVHRIPANRDPSHLHFDFRFLCPTHSQPLSASTDAADARWFTARAARRLGLDEGLERILDKCAQQGLLRE